MYVVVASLMTFLSSIQSRYIVDVSLASADRVLMPSGSALGTSPTPCVDCPSCRQFRPTTRRPGNCETGFGTVPSLKVIEPRESSGTSKPSPSTSEASRSGPSSSSTHCVSCRTFADRPRDARSPDEPGRAQFPYAPPAAFTGTWAANGDVTRLTSLVLGRSKAESVSTFKRALVLRPGMLRRSLRRAGRGSAGRSRTPGIVR